MDGGREGQNTDSSSRSTLITLTTTKAKRRPPPEPNSKASSSGSNGLKRVREGREGSHSRSQSPVKRSREEAFGSVTFDDGSSDVEEVEELSENGTSRLRLVGPLDSKLTCYR